MLRTDIAYAENIEEEVQQASNKGHSYETFSCPSHPGYKLEVMCTKENFTPCLLCIKCLIDPEIHKHSDSFVAIHDTIIRGASTRVSRSHLQIVKDKLEKKLIEFTSIDYLGIYERHADAQMKKVEREVERIKESLENLKKQFKQLFDKEQKYLIDKQEEIKIKIQEFIDEQEEIDNLSNSTAEQILEAMPKIDNLKEYEKIVKVLYHRASLMDRGAEDTMINEIFAIMDDLKDKVSIMKNCRIETSKLDDIRYRIESVEMFDNSLQAFPYSPSADLLQTLDKIRNSEKKRSLVSPKHEDIHSTLKKRADFLGHLQEKLSNADKREAHASNEMQTETSSRRERLNEDKSPALYSPDIKPYDEITLEDKRKPRKDQNDDDGHPISTKKGSNATTQTLNWHNLGANTSHDDKYYRRFDDDRNYKRQRVNATAYREKFSRERHEDDDEEEKEDRHYFDDGLPYSGDFGNHDDEFTFNHPKSFQESQIQKSKNSTVKNKSVNKSISKHTKQEYRKSSIKRIEEGKQSKNQSHSQHKSSQKHKSSLGKKSEIKEKRLAKDKKNKKKKSSKAKDDSSDDSSSDEGSVSRIGKKIERGVHNLHDWINRRVTGYLIFQNTAEVEKVDDDVHLNSVTGKKWKSLSKAEKEEFNSLALSARVDLKKDFSDIDINDPEIKELQELIERKIKKIKKD